jgi:5,10-methylenetetrahydrofolate reductase
VDENSIVPFLTCKHSLDYCLWYSQRAAQQGYRALVVLGGDRHDGIERCVPHAFELRGKIKQKVPELELGGWANPHRDPARQVDYLMAETFGADFYLTQVVSHFDLSRVERFLAEGDRRGLDLPGVFGVFYYRSALPRTLRRLSRFLPVPVEELTEEFARGATPQEVCARTILALRRIGVQRVYISNLPTAGAHHVLASLEQTLSRLEADQ